MELPFTLKVSLQNPEEENTENICKKTSKRENNIGNNKSSKSSITSGTHVTDTARNCNMEMEEGCDKVIKTLYSTHNKEIPSTPSSGNKSSVNSDKSSNLDSGRSTSTSCLTEVKSSELQSIMEKNFGCELNLQNYVLEFAKVPLRTRTLSYFLTVLA